MMKYFIYIFIPMILKSQTNNTNFSSSTLNSNISNINEKINSSSNFNENNSNSVLNTNTNTNKKKNLLIGTFKNYKWHIVAPFFESYNKSNFTNCDCVMFVDHVSKHTLNKLKSLGIIVLPIPIKYNKYPIINYRWKLYEDFINNNMDKYNLVFTADIRDTFFQQDVFKFYDSIKPFLGVALEETTLDNEINRKWMVKAFGEEIYKSMINERIICGGTIGGTPDKFYEFCKLMWDSLKTESSIKIELVDQAMANYLIYHEKKFNDCLIKSDSKNGTIMTIGNGRKFKFDLEDNLLNFKGEIASVIHQYDRHPSILKKVMNKYCPDIVIQIEKEEKIKKFIMIFGVCVLILEIIFFLKHLITKKPKKAEINSNKVLKLSNKSKKIVDELNVSSLNIINSQIN